MIRHWVQKDGTERLHVSGWWARHLRHALTETMAGGVSSLVHPAGHLVVISQGVDVAPREAAPVPVDLTSIEVEGGK